MTNKRGDVKAPELSISRWFNTKEDITLKKLRGRPVLIHAFQMLCPGCVSHGIPQTEKAYSIFEKTDLQILGIHTVFEHHNAMTPIALEAFLHEYRVSFPVGVDNPSGNGGIPGTMTAYAMRGTPTTLLIDRSGDVVANLFGQIEDLALGAMIQSLLVEEKSKVSPLEEQVANQITEQCDDNGCEMPAV